MSSTPTQSDAASRLDALSPAKRAALEKLLLERKAKAASAERITPRDPDEKRQLSFAEQRLWLLDQLEPSHPFYNMPLAARIEGPLDRQAFAQALVGLVARHETLRYAYDTKAGEPARRLADEVTVTPVFVDLRDESHDEAALMSLLRAEARMPFDLAEPPLLRCVVYELADDERIVLLVMHHIVSDGWSMWVMLNELSSLYEAALRGCSAPLLPLPIQYSDYGAWQRERLSGKLADQQMDYWRERLAGSPPSLEMPADRPRLPTQDFDGAVHRFEFTAELSQQLRTAADQSNATPFMVLMAAYQAWLARYSGQRDLCVGTVVAGRTKSELERLIGFFVNTLALRGDLTDDPTFAELLKQVREETLGAFDHQELPFEQVIESAAPDRDRSHDALFSTALVVQNPPRDFATSEGMKVTPMLVDNGTAKYDLTFFFWEEAGRWVGQVEYRTSLFDAATIDRFVCTYQTLLSDGLENPEKPTSRLEIVDAAQRQAIAGWNETRCDFGTPKLIHDLILRWAITKPDATAIVHNQREITYAELDQLTNKVAAGLQALGVGADTPVLMALPRSADALVAMLGIWRAGGVYVPVDPVAGRQRLEYIASDSGASRIISDASIDPPPGCQRVTLAELLASESKFQQPELSPSDRAYVIYTSGSTGEPKGVEVEHGNIANFVVAQRQRMRVTDTDRVLHCLSPVFDGGLAEALLALGNGATSVLADLEVTLDPRAFTKLLQDKQVTVGKYTPALLATLDPTELPGLSTVVSAGDLLTGDLASRWQPGRRFFNGYGPTEVTVGVSMYELPAPPTSPPPVGAPMANMRAYVLDANQQMTPVGVVGEIYIAGAGVARGYLNRPEATAERFLPDPFAAATNGRPPRMYRTGDLGRWRADGVLEFAGRVDDQVQLRGYRVEPGEVTAALEALDPITQAYTCVHADETGNRLVSYVVPQETESSTNSPGVIDEHLASWQSLMTQTHQNTGALRDPEFDVTGWVSTFTGLPIPKEEMRRWADVTIQRVLDLNPRKVLEIGCGSGIILQGVAPHCESYVGADFLQRSLEQLRRVLDHKSDAWTDHVELYEQAAHEAGPLAGRQFDTIVLNSVVQYFPSLDYLIEVLRVAASLLGPGGQIFLGDLRNLHLQEAMASAVEVGRADANLTRRELLGRIEGRLRHEEELLLAPELLAALPSVLPRMTSYSIDLKQGADENELVRYRFDAVLRFDTALGCDGEDLGKTPQTIAWAPGEESVDAAVGRFIAGDAASAIVPTVVNARVSHDMAVWKALQQGDEQLSVGQLREETSLDSASDPDTWREAARAAGCECEVWPSTQTPEAFDVHLRRRESQRQALSPAGPEPDWRRLANRPLDEKRTAKLAPQLRQGLADRLPAYMIPTAFVLMDSLPRNVQGKVDRAALPPPPSGRPVWASGYVEPRNDAERLVANVWEELLGVSPVGAEDNFFELGGHSMLAVRVTTEIEARTGVAIPLAALFQEPTVRHLATVLSDPESAADAASLVPLQTTGEGAPLFCIHPAGGTVFCYKALAAHFAGQRPVIGVQAVGVDGARPPHETMTEMAVYYANLIRRRQPNGPYHLCGWSLGGNIAYAVAQQLAEQGGEVGLLALFDAGATPPEESLSEDDLGPLLQALFPDLDHLPLEEIRQLDAEQQTAYFTERAMQAGLVEATQLAASKHVFAVFQKNVQAVHQHPTTAYAGKVSLFRAAQQAGTNPLADDPQLGWGATADEVEVLDVATDHTQMMNPPQVDALAKMVAEKLDTLE